MQSEKDQIETNLKYSEAEREICVMGDCLPVAFRKSFYEINLDTISTEKH